MRHPRGIKIKTPVMTGQWQRKSDMQRFPGSLTGLATVLLMLAACDQPLDMDMRGAFGNAPSTAEAARTVTAPRPEPDERGIISYPGYQVAVARRNDTVAGLARRIGMDPQGLAQFNGMQTGDVLREGEIIALPRRVAEPEGGPIKPSSDVDISSIAGDAIRRADAQAIETTTLAPASQTGTEPVRHRVERGETAFSIARLYDVSIRSLADWNGLGPDFGVREGQYLLIPVALSEARAETGWTEQDAPPEQDNTTVTPPGMGSPTPTPPSASKPLPDETTIPAAKPVETIAAPDLGATQTTPDTAAMAFPVRGDIVRDYAKGVNEGIDIAASAGAAVGAAQAGTVAAITEDTKGIPIIVVRHDGNLLTVYSNIESVAVAKGDSVARGQKLARVRDGSGSAVHFEVRNGFESVDPMTYLKPDS